MDIWDQSPILVAFGARYVFSFCSSITFHFPFFSSAFVSSITTYLHFGISKTSWILFGIFVLSKLLVNARNAEDSFIQNKSINGIKSTRS